MMIKCGDTSVSMEFDNERYTGKFSIHNPKLNDVFTTEKDNPLKYKDALEIAIALVVESILERKKFGGD